MPVPNISQLFRLALPSLRPVEQWRLPQGLGLTCAPGSVMVAQPTSAPRHGLVGAAGGGAAVAPLGPVSLLATLFVVDHPLWVPTLPPLAPRPITEVRTYAWPSGQRRGTCHLPGGTIVWAAPTGADTLWCASFETGAQLGTFLPPAWRQVTIHGGRHASAQGGGPTQAGRRAYTGNPLTAHVKKGWCSRAEEHRTA